MSPTNEEHVETLKDGRRVLIRPIRPDDVTRNAAFLDGLSPPSKHFLFLGGISRLSDQALERMCALDHEHEMAYVALAVDEKPQRQVGICRYAGGGATDGAEIAVAVADDWQHHGLGKRLLSQLIEYARAHGIPRLYSMDSRANQRMRKLAQDFGFSERADPDNRSQVVCYLDLSATNRGVSQSARR